MEAFKTELINDKGDIEEISIKSELERQNFLTQHSYLCIEDIEDFKKESKYIKKQNEIKIERDIKEKLNNLYNKDTFGYIFKKKDWKPRRFF